MSNIISFPKMRKPDVTGYVKHINSLDKLELIEEMVRFQEERSHRGELTPEMIVSGIVLFGVLAKVAETDELAMLCRSYLRHLEHESKEFFGY